MMLTASYVLLTLGGGREQVRSGMTYVVISLIASTLFITALALIYSATGTVNMADLAGQASASCPAACGGVRRAAGRGLRHQGRRCSRCSPGCPTPTRGPAAVTAVFAGLLTKVGVYAMIRSQTLLFTDDEPPGHAHARAGRR